VRTAQALDPNLRTLRVELQVDNAQGELFPGSYSEIHFELPGSSSTWRIPATALIFRSQGLQVAVIGPDSGVGRATVCRMSLGSCLYGSLLTLGACSFAPHYSVPTPPTPPPAQYQELAGWKPSQPADTGDRGNWWTVFRDPLLDSLEDRVTVDNQNVKAAFARLQQARAQTRIERSAYFPTLNLQAGATRSRTSTNAPLYTNTKPATGNDFVLDADLSYEVDVWGRIRNTVTAARASERASAADLASLDLSMHAELATDYFTLCGLDTEQALLQQTVADYTRALQLTQALFDGGAAARADLDQARAQLESARTSATDIGLRRAQTEHAIAVLVGELPSTFHLDSKPLQVGVEPPPIAAGEAFGAARAPPRRRSGRAQGRRRKCADRSGARRVFPSVRSVSQSRL
jgi:outer membrane protein TolC